LKRFYLIAFMHITLIAGTRPNFVKIAPIIHEILRRKRLGADVEYSLIHTGQHYDTRLTDLFFEELNIPEPTVNLGIGSGSQALQTGSMMTGIEAFLLQNPTDLVLVVGDVNSTLAATLSAKKLNIPVAHVEAGIRSRDTSMPEEINRMIVDAICDMYFTTTEAASSTLVHEGKHIDSIHFVGNVMIDTLLRFSRSAANEELLNTYNLKAKDYLLLTLHRPSNVDDTLYVKKLLTHLSEQAKGQTILFPVHPRTSKILATLDLKCPNLQIVPALGYLDFICLLKSSLGIITDSGGITEEATVLNIPCMTLRTSTERPETCTLGTNVLVGTDFNLMSEGMRSMQNRTWKQSNPIPLWDGRAAERIMDVLLVI
jgi:UDP-N-acetylglucosamine 2-epimerase (non-hydrolysing)